MTRFLDQLCENTREAWSSSNNDFQSFHEGMSAKVIVGQEFTERIGVCNGLRQGCTMAPVLFSLYFAAVVDDWTRKCSVTAVEFRYKYGHKLVGDRTIKSQLLLDMITESQFADDAALYATSEQKFQTVAQSFVSVASSWGLTVGQVKTKGMMISNESSFVDGVPVCDQSVDMAKEFPCLGSAITSDGEIDADVKMRIAKAANVFGCLKTAIFTNQGLSLDVKRAVYNAVI